MAVHERQAALEKTESNSDGLTDVLREGTASRPQTSGLELIQRTAWLFPREDGGIGTEKSLILYILKAGIHWACMLSIRQL